LKAFSIFLSSAILLFHSVQSSAKTLPLSILKK
jgi:hypothetical protein